MNNKRLKALIPALVFVLVLASLPAFALAGEKLLIATVVSGEEAVILAPYSGVVLPFTVQPGDAAAAGRALFSIKPKDMVAQAEGTVAAVHTKDGGSASGAVSRYGAVLQIEHKNRYELNLTMRTGYNAPENRDLWVGTPVFLRSVDGRKFGLGTIISVGGGSFTVEIESGNLEYDEEVRAYRVETYDAKALLGRAKPSLVPPYMVTASGTVLSMKAERGDKVRQGDILFSYVPDSLTPAQRAAKGTAGAKEDMVISAVLVSPGVTVAQDQALARGYPVAAMQLRAQVEEKDVSDLAIGTQATVFFEELGLEPILAQVIGIAALGSGEDIASFTVTFDFEAPPQVRFGMHATVQVP